MFHSQKWAKQLQTYFSIHGNAAVSELILESHVRGIRLRGLNGGPLCGIYCL